MGLRKFWQAIDAHPLARRQRWRASARFLAWQLRSLLLLRRGRSAPVKFVDESRLLARRGETGVTGNLYFGLHEVEEMSLLAHLIRPGEGVIDVGANIGSFTILAAARGANVLAFEPVHRLAKRLEANVALNGFQHLVRVRQVAVGASPGVVRISQHAETTNRVATTSSPDADASPSASQNDRERAVDLVTIDQQLAVEQWLAESGDLRYQNPSGPPAENRARPFPPPVAIKIDVEGYEPAVLAGAQQTLATSSVNLLIWEANVGQADYGFDPEAVRQQVLDTGFQTVRYDPFERQLQPTDEPTPAGNWLAVRDLSRAEARLQSAPPLIVRQANVAL